MDIKSVVAYLQVSFLLSIAMLFCQSSCIACNVYFVVILHFKRMIKAVLNKTRPLSLKKQQRQEEKN